MMKIDSYCEKVLGDQTNGTISVLPGGVSREEFVYRMDILIPVFAELTPYSEADFRSGKTLLLLLKKYCFSKKILSDFHPEEDFSAYYSKTLEMLEGELARLAPDAEGNIAPLDADKTFTIISNTMQLLTSAMLAGKKEKEMTNAQVLGINLPFMKEKQTSLSLVREDTAVSDIIPYLDEVYEITKNYQRTRNSPVGNKTSYEEWIEYKYLKLVLGITRCRLDEIGVF